MYNEIFTSTDEGWLDIVEWLLKGGTVISPRGLKTKEESPAVLEFGFIRYRYINPTGRNLNLPFALTEAIDILLGKNPGHAIYLSKAFKAFMNKNTRRFDGHYGDRLYKPSVNQILRCYQTLKKDPKSRQAVITIHNPLMENYSGKDIACTMSFQFLIRDQLLNMITYMRSNDAYLGFCYDTMTFQFIQELMACWLGIEPGRYIHICGSLHLYDRHWNNVKEILKKRERPYAWEYNATRFETTSYMETFRQLEAIHMAHMWAITKLHTVPALASKRICELIEIVKDPLLRNIVCTLIAEQARRQKFPATYSHYYSQITNEYRHYFATKEGATK